MTTAYAWVLSTRPKTLILSVFPFVLGTLLAFPDVLRIQWYLLAYAMGSALCIQIGTNLINEAIDVVKGADNEARIGPRRGLQAGILTVNQVYWGGILCFALALLLGIPLVVQGGYPLLAALLASVFFGYIYTGGPMPLAYHGLGEIFVLLFFGFVSVVSGYYLQTHALHIKAVLGGLQLGLLATLPIAINNLRDINEDAKASKKTLAVRFGENFGRMEITVLTATPFLLNLQWPSILMTFLPWLSFPVAFKILEGVWTTPPSKKYNQFLGMSILLYTSFTLLLIIGYLL